MDDLKSGVEKGQLALIVLMGPTFFSNFEVRTTPDARWERHLPPMPPGTLTKWSLSPSYDALARNLERPLTADEMRALSWQDVEAEPPGFVVLSRYRDAPHPRVTPNPTEAPRAAARHEGPLRADVHRFRPRAGEETRIGAATCRRVLQRRDPLARPKRRLPPAVPRIVNPENDLLPAAEEGRTSLLAVSELGGGWGFVCRLVDPPR